MRDDRYIHNGWQPHTHGTHTCVTAVCSLATYYLLVPSGTCSDTGVTPVPVYYIWQAHKLFVLPSFSFATAVLQLQLQCSGSGHAARSAVRSAACCVLRALRAAAVCRSCSCVAAVLFSDVVVVVVVCACAYTHTYRHSHQRVAQRTV